MSRDKTNGIYFLVNSFRDSQKREARRGASELMYWVAILIMPKTKCRLLCTVGKDMLVGLNLLPNFISQTVPMLP